jgi:L,D-transpeptidase ErfK/SrfK
MILVPRRALTMKALFPTVFASLSLAAPAWSASYPLPLADQGVIGEVQHAVSHREDTLLDIGRKFGVGYAEIVAANPGVDPWLPGEGTDVLIPSQFVLPDAPRDGIVVSLAEHRLYYFPKQKLNEAPIVSTYAISVGRMDWKTPLGLTRIVDKRVRPIWYPPASVREEHAADGRPLPMAVPPGPDNPLGEYAMRLAIPGGAYLIHGTNKPAGVGMDVTHGCIRMFPEDIEEFFKLVPVNTPVRIVHQPYKMGWKDGTLFMEAHAPLEGDDDPQLHSLTEITRVLVGATKDRPANIDWSLAEAAMTKPNGVPFVIFQNASAAGDVVKAAAR